MHSSRRRLSSLCYSKRCHNIVQQTWNIPYVVPIYVYYVQHINNCPILAPVISMFLLPDSIKEITEQIIMKHRYIFFLSYSLQMSNKPLTIVPIMTCLVPEMRRRIRCLPTQVLPSLLPPSLDWMRTCFEDNREDARSQSMMILRR